MTAIPIERRRGDHRDSDDGIDLDRAIHEQFGRDEAERGRKTDAGQAR